MNANANTELDCDVLIIGAGPVGLTLALAAQRSGIRTRIVEQATGFSGQSKAITVQPRILEQWHLLDVAKPLIEAGLCSSVMHMHDGRTKLATLRYDLLPTAFPYYLHLHQGQTERLLDAVLNERGSSVERGVRFVRYDVRKYATSAGGDLHEYVEAHLIDREGESLTVRCRYLVGCDGGHSQVRAGLNVAFSGDKHADNWIMADVRIANFDLAPDERHGFMLKTYPFVILPMQHGYYRVIAARTADSPHRGQNPDLEEFAEIARKLGFDHWRFEDPLWLTNYSPSQFIASEFRCGPVFIAGDAAHVNTPIAAQGLNTGVMDAVNLAWKLAWVLRHGASEQLLDSYHAERHPIVMGMFRANNRLTSMVFGRNRLVRTIIRKQLHMLRLPRLNLRNTGGSSQISVAYLDSPITLRLDGAMGWFWKRFADRGAVLGGERVPCPALPVPSLGASHLYDLLESKRHTLLVFEHADPTVSAWTSRLASEHAEWLQVLCFSSDNSAKGPGYYLDPEKKIAAAFGARNGCAVLVRPDAFIAGRFTHVTETKIDSYRRLLLGQKKVVAERCKH